MAETGSLSITASIAGGAALPADAELDVELLDVSRADAPSVRIASRRVAITTLPRQVEIPYDSAAIDPRMTYVIAARVLSGGAVALRTTTAYPVLTRGASEHVAIVLEPTADPQGVTTQRIAGVPWAVTEIGGRALVADDPPTIAFLEDGAFALYGSCNRFHGTARLEPGRIAFVAPIAGTRRMCPPPRMRLEQDVLEALDRTTSYQRTGARLAFTNESGVVTIRFHERPE